MNLKFFTAGVLVLALSGNVSADAARYSIQTHLKTSVVKEQIVERKRAAIKLSPNPSTNGTVNVVSNTAGTLNFYIFDQEGTLLHQAVIAAKEQHTVSHLKKGVYTYDAFYNDEGVEHGKLIVK